MAALVAAVAVGTLALTLATSTGQPRLLPSLSTTVLAGREQQQQLQQRQTPLAVLSTNPPQSGDRSRSTLEVFAEDTRWASKV